MMDYDLATASLISRPFDDTVPTNNRYKQIEARIRDWYDYADPDKKLPARELDIERKAMNTYVAEQRERDREALGIPERFGRETVYVYHLKSDQFELSDEDEKRCYPLSALFKPQKIAEPTLQVLLTSKQRRTIMAHNGGVSEAQGMQVEGDMRRGFTWVTLPQDQVKVDGVRIPVNPVVVVPVYLDHPFLRGPVDKTVT